MFVQFLFCHSSGETSDIQIVSRIKSILSYIWPVPVYQQTHTKEMNIWIRRKLSVKSKDHFNQFNDPNILCKMPKQNYFHNSKNDKKQKTACITSLKVEFWILTYLGMGVLETENRSTCTVGFCNIDTNNMWNHVAKITIYITKPIYIQTHVEPSIGSKNEKINIHHIPISNTCFVFEETPTQSSQEKKMCEKSLSLEKIHYLLRQYRHRQVLKAII
jgi:hypothetical protein